MHVGPFLSSNLFQKSPLVFSKINRKKHEKRKIFPKLRNLTEGKISGRLRIPISRRKKMETMKIQTFRVKKKTNFRQKSLDKNGPYAIFVMVYKCDVGIM